VTTTPAGPHVVPLPGFGLNIFGTLANNPSLFEAFRSLGSHLLRDGLLPARARELVILRVGWRAGSEYEFGQHTRIGAAAGLTAAEIDAVADADVMDWDAADRALIDLVDELCADDAVSEQTWSRVAQHHDDASMLELLVLVGFYRLVSGLLNSVHVALEPQTPGWPAHAQPRRHAPRETQAEHE
jgi:alkylhydroperoxidase family enzyme